ncbi:MAG: hypothetical protein WAO58_06610 [Fimbriimonadaceae bacterium]
MTISTTEARLARLERNNRLLSLALIVGVGVSLMGWTRPADVIKAKELQIISSQGKTMVTIGAGNREKGGEITLSDAKGDKQGYWTASRNFSLLRLGGFVRNSPHATLASGEGASSFSLRGMGQDYALASLYAGKEPIFELRDKPRHVVFSAPKPARN